ncbi:MAG TPA: hypothetical protein VEZ52_08760, partial [Desulfovibrio sp.]|uniref:hypothetical protein n=1 Tax=Desulfovibrio sp. TaxID=885 RepID=UPI002D22F6C4
SERRFPVAWAFLFCGPQGIGGQNSGGILRGKGSAITGGSGKEKGFLPAAHVLHPAGIKSLSAET